MSKRLLYFNLAVNEKDTSLGFAIKWIETISENFDHVDVVTLKHVTKSNFTNSVNIFGAKPSKNKYLKYIYLIKQVRYLTVNNTYDRCFSHMSPISIVLCFYYLVKNKIKTTLWFTHPGPRFGFKKLILYLSLKFSEYVVTASESSFPFDSKKVKVIGHAIDMENFNSRKEVFKFNKFLILSRISTSKNIEVAIDAFLNSKYKDCDIDIIGGPLNENDKKYLKKLKNKYSSYNVNFLGKIEHTLLPEILTKYDVHFNCAKNGFYDKSVLETLSCEIINFYKNDDFDNLFNTKKFNFENSIDLTNKLNNLDEFSNEDISEIFKYTKNELLNNSLTTLNKRLTHYL